MKLFLVKSFKRYRTWKLKSKLKFYLLCIFEFFLFTIFVAAIVGDLNQQSLIVCVITAVMIGICGNFRQQRYSELKKLNKEEEI